jgi:hypothetical protein
MERRSYLAKLYVAIGLIGLLTGCGSGTSPSGTASGSASGTAAASGTITGFGSLFVNGKKFETNGVEVEHDGIAARCTIGADPSQRCGLKVGMTVVVSGSFHGTQRSASTVRRKDAVEGLVQSVAADGLSLLVLGQTVLVDNTTIIDDNVPGQNILNLVAGMDNVEVDGLIRPDGVIQATFIERKLANVTPEVRGFVKNHNDRAKTFQIGSLTVNYATAIINDMPNPAGNTWNGLLVEVKGTPFNAATTTLTATNVEPENRGIGNDVDEFEVEGFVTQVLGLGDFFIGSTQVQTTSSTEFRGGTIDEIVVGAKLSAEGRLANGILTAKQVRFHESVKLEGDIAAINLAANTFTITGLPGVTVTVNSQTEFKANGGHAITGLGDLAAGDHVRVRGRATGTSFVIATRVERRSADDEVDLQGPVQAASNPNLTILGVTVNTAGISESDFKGIDDAVIGRAAFFNAVTVGTLVKLKGRLTAGVVTWREVELEDVD